LAFSTGNPGGISTGLAAANQGYDRLRFVPWGAINPFYAAVVQATEEAVANALVANEEMTGRDGHRSPALPRDRVAAAFGGRAAVRPQQEPSSFQAPEGPPGTSS
jgi:D-aminopeptidase